LKEKSPAGATEMKAFVPDLDTRIVRFYAAEVFLSAAQRFLAASLIDTDRARVVNAGVG
jgi:hypothetical protein